MNSSPVPLYAGHRERIRQRFIHGGFSGMLPYEVMEALLTIVLPRKDVKPLAKQLIERYENISQVLELPLEKLEKLPGISRITAIKLKMLRELVVYLLQEKFVSSGNLLDNPEAAINFIRMKIGAQKHEWCMAIFLDSHHHLISFHIISEGTVNYIFSYRRNIVEMALNEHASGVIIAHNHPSGVCEPSAEDINSTAELWKTLNEIDVKLLDHFIVCRDKAYSFAANGISLSGTQEGTGK